MPTKRKDAPKRRPGRQIKHGAYALIYREEILKKYPEVARYAMDCRAGLVKDLAPGGPDTLSTAKMIVLDRLTAKLLTAGLLDVFLGEHGLIRRDRLDQRVLEAEPIVQTWLSVNHAILKDLEALGMERKALEAIVLSTEEMIVAVNEERAAAKAAEVKKGALAGVEVPTIDVQGKTIKDPMDMAGDLGGPTGEEKTNG